MLVFVKENLALLSVPKTGSTALEAALAPRAAMVLRDPPQLKHAPLYRFNRFLRPMFTTAAGTPLQTMALVRHPEDWLGSWYRYRSRDALCGHPNSTKDVSFDAFVRDYCSAAPSPRANVGSQARFVGYSDSQSGVDHLFRYEAWDKAIRFLEIRLQAPIKTKKLNVSPRLRLSLTEETRALLQSACVDEFAVWHAAQH